MSAPPENFEDYDLVQCPDCDGHGCADCHGEGRVPGLTGYDKTASEAIWTLAEEIAERSGFAPPSADCAIAAATSLLSAAFSERASTALDLQNLRAELARAEDGHEECDVCSELLVDTVEVHGQALGPDVERVHRACYDANKPSGAADS